VTESKLPSPWWFLKAAGGLGLIGLSSWAMIEGRAQPLPDGPPRVVAQAAVLLGAGVELWHFFLLKRGAGSLAEPKALVTEGGLLSFVRHPMYLGDLLWMAGMLLLHVSLASFAAAALGTIGLLGQVRHEEGLLAARFPDEHAAWVERSWLLFPPL